MNSSTFLAKLISVVYGSVLSGAVALSVAVVAEKEAPAPELFPMDQPLRFFLLLTIISIVGSGGRLLVQWEKPLPIRYMIGSVMLSVVVADLIAFSLWGHVELAQVMGIAGATAALGGQVADAAFRKMAARIMGGP